MFYTFWVWGDGGLSKWKCPFSSWSLGYQITEMRKIVLNLHRKHLIMKIRTCHSSLQWLPDSLRLKLQSLTWFPRHCRMSPHIVSDLISYSLTPCSSPLIFFMFLKKHSEVLALRPYPFPSLPDICSLSPPSRVWFYLTFSVRPFQTTCLQLLPLSLHTPKPILLPHFSP